MIILGTNPHSFARHCCQCNSDSMFCSGFSHSPTGPDLENRMCDEDIGSPGRPVSSGLQVPGELGHCRA